MPLFEVAVISKPTKKEIEEGTAEEQLVLPPTHVIARDGQSAAIKALRAFSEQINLDRCDVLVRPFLTFTAHWSNQLSSIGNYNTAISGVCNSQSGQAFKASALAASKHESD